MRCVALVLAAAFVWSPLAHADWTVRRDPFDRTVVARYKAILAKDPYDPALAALTSMYRRYRTLAQLDDEYRGSDGWASLVVRARIARDKEPQRALELWTRAVAANDGDARGWLAIGELATKREDAMAALGRALQRTSDAALQRTILRTQIHRALDDISAKDRAYERLVALDPKDGKLWLDRADALLASGLAVSALASYEQAEALLAQDPERKLYVIWQRGRANETSGDTDKALVDYHRALDAAPKGYFLVRAIVDQIVAIHRKERTLPALIGELEGRWRTRGYFEWATLGALYEETGERDKAIAALQNAVAKSPIELDTQRKLVELLDAASRGTDAIAQLERAARAAPGDIDIQLQLAQRYWPARNKDAIATLQRLSRTLANNIGAHEAIGELLWKWHRMDLGVHEYELVAKLEPTDEHIDELGERYWDAGEQKGSLAKSAHDLGAKSDQQKAIATWRRLVRTGSAAEHERVATLFSNHGLWSDAIEAYSKAIAKNDHNAELYRARSNAYAIREDWWMALSDAEKAVELIGTAPYAEGHPIRYNLVSLELRADEKQHWSDLEAALTRWQDRFDSDPPDIAAGYMLVEVYGSQPGPLHAHVLQRMHQLVPGDHGLTLELVRTLRVLRRFDDAKQLVQDMIAAGRKDLDDMLAQIEYERLHARPRAPEYIEDPELERRANAEYSDGTPHVAGGIRIGMGAGVRGDMDRSFTVGALTRWGSGVMQAVARLEYFARNTAMDSTSGGAFSIGVTGRVVTTRNMAIAIGVAQRFQSCDTTTMPDLCFSADATLDVIARQFPATTGLRFEQGLSDHGRDSALFFELGVELR